MSAIISDTEFSRLLPSFDEAHFLGAGDWVKGTRYEAFRIEGKVYAVGVDQLGGPRWAHEIGEHEIGHYVEQASEGRR